MCVCVCVCVCDKTRLADTYDNQIRIGIDGAIEIDSYYFFLSLK